MPKHEEKRLMPYKAEDMFKLVADIEKYPEFLPWCQSCSIISHQGNDLKANLTVGYKFFRESFISQVILEPNTRIEVNYLNGPFRYLKNIWTFQTQADDPNFSVLNFFIDFEFRSKLMQKLVENMFTDSCHTMVRAFENRAKSIFLNEDDINLLAS